MASFRPLCPDALIPDPGADYRAADRAEQFRMGAEALYLPAFPGTKYLPYAAVRRAWVQKGTSFTPGCGSTPLPRYVLRVQYGENFFQNLSFDRPETADEALAALAAACPGIPLQPENKA